MLDYENHQTEELRTARARLRAAHPQTVDIRLPVDKDKPKSLLVSVNGRRYLIERGRVVTVPWAVAQVIEQSAASDEALRERIAQLTEHPTVAVI